MPVIFKNTNALKKTIELEEISSLLNGINTLLTHQKEIEKIKGETFNIFSILGVESKENKTHSNFIAELLNPNGSHLQGSVFLELFLETIEYKNTLSFSSLNVIKEHHIGRKTNSDGGRIDILITDFNNYISIENKIYAGDQENQLIRYCNFKKECNKVYYLTLFGEEATDLSIKDSNLLTEKEGYKLKNGEDYYTLSYSYDILNWLKLCYEKSVNIPQLRESIKQYILLIQKLTNQNMNDRQKMINLLFKNHEAANVISTEFHSLRHHIRRQFREDVVKKIKQQFSDKKFEIKTPNAIHKKGIAQIFFYNKSLGINEYEFEILIESFNDNGHHNGNVFIGILDFNSNYNNYPIEEISTGFNNKYWKTAKFLYFNEKHINFRDNSFLDKIKDPNSECYKTILDVFVIQCTDFISEFNPKIEEYFKLGQHKTIQQK